LGKVTGVNIGMILIAGIGGTAEMASGAMIFSSIFRERSNAGAIQRSSQSDIVFVSNSWNLHMFDKVATSSALT